MDKKVPFLNKKQRANFDYPKYKLNNLIDHMYYKFEVKPVNPNFRLFKLK